MDITGKVFFISGAARSIGRGMAEAVLNKGGKVFIADINSTEGKETTAVLQTKYGIDRVKFRSCDIRDIQQFTETFESAVKLFGHIDVMVNNAGMANEKYWEKTIATNLNGTIHGTNLALKHMRKDEGGKGGLILNTDSITGLDPYHTIPVYSATKCAIIGFTRAWAANPKIPSMGVRLACLCPTVTETPINDFEPDQVIDLEGHKAKHAAIGFLQIPEVADAFIKLVEDEHCNGKLMFVTPGKDPHYVTQYVDPPVTPPTKK